MSLELTNLLPEDRKRQMGREYYLRLATVSAYTLGVVVCMGIALLAPSFLYLHDEITVRQGEIQHMNQGLTAPGGQSASAELVTLSATASSLARLASTTTATGALRAILGQPHSGITLNGFTFAPPTQGANGTMMLTGTASTRENLRAYVAALSVLPYVTSADLPISAYAKDTDIPFTITLTGSLAPSS